MYTNTLLPVMVHAGTVDTVLLEAAAAHLGWLVPGSPQLLCWWSLPHLW